MELGIYVTVALKPNWFLDAQHSLILNVEDSIRQSNQNFQIDFKSFLVNFSTKGQLANMLV